MVVLIYTCKNEEDPIKSESARRVTTLNTHFQKLNGSNSAVDGGVGPKFELIQTFIVVLVTGKNDIDQSKKEQSLEFPILMAFITFPQLVY